MMAFLFEIGVTNALLTAILAVVVFAMTRFWRNPHLAHFLWLLVLLKMVTPPIINVPISLGFNWDENEVATSAPIDSDELLSTLPFEASQVGNQAIEPVDSTAVVDAMPLESASSQKNTVLLASSESAKSLWPIYAATAWLGGSLVCGLLACVRIVQFHRKLKETDPAGESVQRIGKSVADELGLKLYPDLRITDSRLSPMVWPIGRPATVVLPIGLVEDLDEEQLRTIVAHEYGHIARRDSWVRWLEVVCTVLHWWNPCLWLARSEIRKAEELCCDALVMESYPGCSHSFGESLLRVDDFLSGVPYGASFLVSEMRGAGQMKKRIERIINGQLPPRLSRTTQIVLIISALAILPLSAQEPQGERSISVRNAKAASIGDIIEGLKDNEQAVKSLVVKFQTTSTHNFTKPGSGPLGKNMIEDDAVSTTSSGSVSWEVTREGRVRMAAKYMRVNSRFDGSKKEKQEEYISTFNGSSGQFLSIVRTPAGVVVQRYQRPTENFMATSLTPFDLTIRQLGKPISTLVFENDGKIIGNKEWEKRSVVVVEVSPVVVRDDYLYKQQFWIDTERSYLVVRTRSYVQRGEGMPWGLHYQIDRKQHQEVTSGIWLPKVIDIWNYHVTTEGQDFLTSREHIEASDWSVNEELNASRFELEPEGINRIGMPIATVPSPAKNDVTVRNVDGSAQAKENIPGFRNMDVKVVDSQGRAVPQAGIYVSIWPEGSYKKTKRNYTTDDKGQVTVLVPNPPRLFRMWTQKEGYVPLFAQWWPEHQPDGHLIPKEFTFALPSGTEVGGVIEDDDGNPIEGAIVEVALGNQIDEMGRRPIPSMWLAEAPGPGNNPCITDVEGRWTLNNVPAGDEIFIRVKLTHPKYISDTRWGGLQEEQSIPMKAFRDKSATIAMHRGAVVTGVITDPTGKPVSDAVVIWGDNPYEQDGSQEVRTNAEGVYRLQPLSAGPMNVTVVAPGWSPESRAINILASGSTENFQLEKGKSLRIRFVDEDGGPVPNVYVGVRGWRGRQSLYNHRHPNVLNTKIPVKSDNDGAFKWEWAPSDEVDFSFYAKGYREVSQALTADNTEHTVTLSKSIP